MVPLYTLKDAYEYNTALNLRRINYILKCLRIHRGMERIGIRGTRYIMIFDIISLLLLLSNVPQTITAERWLKEWDRFVYRNAFLIMKRGEIFQISERFEL